MYTDFHVYHLVSITYLLYHRQKCKHYNHDPQNIHNKLRQQNNPGIKGEEKRISYARGSTYSAMRS